MHTSIVTASRVQDADNEYVADSLLLGNVVESRPPAKLLETLAPLPFCFLGMLEQWYCPSFA